MSRFATEPTQGALMMFDLVPDLMVVDPQITEAPLLWPLCPQV